MRCEHCEALVEEGEQRELHGRLLCEDCYMDLLSRPKICDPWAVYSAKTFFKNGNSDIELTPIQLSILEILQDEGPQEPANLCKRIQIKEADLERDIAVLRHMEKVRGELKGEKKFIRLW